jgi:7-cyano-7-deazaguanine synthase
MHQQPPIAVLVSGGLDSCILLAECCRRHSAVHPLYVRNGLSWEGVELTYLRRFLEAIRKESLQPLQILEMPVADIYGTHWSTTGENVPGADTPDEAVFLPGRNVLLLAKAILWCHLNQVSEVALAPLGSNPFPDATPAFFAAYQDVVNQAVGGRVRVSRPYATLHKTDVMERGQQLPLQLTFSCIRPIGERHCGRCNKCAERRRAFIESHMPDPTDYAQEELCSA